MVYKEPFLLHQLAQMHRLDPDYYFGMTNPDIIEIALAILGKTYNSSEIPVIKPTDSCINIARELLMHQTKSAAVLLYKPLEQFIITMLKSQERLEYMRGMTQRAWLDLITLGRCENIVYRELDDVQAISIVWVALMYYYLDLLEDADLNVRSLESSVLFSRTEATCISLSKLFGIPCVEEYYNTLLGSGVLSRNSKNQRELFNADAQSKLVESLKLNYEKEIETAVTWVSDITKQKPIPKQLPRALVV